MESGKAGSGAQLGVSHSDACQNEKPLLPFLRQNIRWKKVEQSTGGYGDLETGQSFLEVHVANGRVVRIREEV